MSATTLAAETMRVALALALTLALAACSSQPGPRARVIYTSSDGIAFQQPGGAVHFYRFKNKGN